MDFSTITAVTIPEGNVVKIERSGIVLWQILDNPDYLIDFECKRNGNDTYTLTAWNGTYQGELSTELIIPDEPSIVL